LKQPEREAARWMLQARDDLEFVKWVLSEGRFFDKGCFLAQQAAEKAVKACLYMKGARVVLGHSVAELLERLLESLPDFAKHREAARLLDRFYIPTRYPNGLPAGTPSESFKRSDLEQALSLADPIVRAAERALGK